MLLAQLSFPIDYTSFHAFLVATVPNADGLCTADAGYLVIEKSPFTSTDITNVNGYYNSLTQAGESAKLHLSTQQMVMGSIESAMQFGQQLTVEYAAQNVLAGITQAAKTQAVADYLQNVSYYMNAGSLYAAMNEMNDLIADTSDTKTALSPYVTNDILYIYLNKIQTYLEIPLTPNPGS